MNLEPEREPLRPSPEPQRDDPRLAPGRGVQRIARPAAPPTGAPPSVPPETAPPAPPVFTRFQKFVRVISVALLLATAGLMVTGQDPKPNLPPPPPAITAQAESIPNEIVVDLRDDVTDSQIAALQQQYGIVLRYNSPLSVKSKLMVGIVDPDRRDAVIQSLRANPLVEAVDRQYIYQLQNRTFVPNDPNYKDQWHLTMIGMEEAWTHTKGAGASVAIIDSGVGMIQNNTYVQGRDFASTKFRAGHDWVDGDDIPADENRHGTHVAGTIAESTDNGILGAGVAPEAEIMALRVTDARGGGRGSDFAEALQYLSEHPTSVANKIGRAHV